MLALAALQDWYLTGLDVRNAYLYGELEEELYMEQPEGFKINGQEHKVLHLNRALYGLKQAGLAWWQMLSKSIKQLGFTCLTSDSGLYVYRQGNNLVVVIVYVDNAIFCGPNKALVHDLKNKFMAKWECCDLGDIKEFLCMNITRDGSNI